MTRFEKYTTIKSWLHTANFTFKTILQVTLISSFYVPLDFTLCYAESEWKIQIILHKSSYSQRFILVDINESFTVMETLVNHIMSLPIILLKLFKLKPPVISKVLIGQGNLEEVLTEGKFEKIFDSKSQFWVFLTQIIRHFIKFFGAIWFKYIKIWAIIELVLWRR